MAIGRRLKSRYFGRDFEPKRSAGIQKWSVERYKRLPEAASGPPAGFYRIVTVENAHRLLDVVVAVAVEFKRRHNPEFGPDMLLAIVESASKRVLPDAQLAREDLESGFTTVRNLGRL
jgi:hypothetical protein